MIDSCGMKTVKYAFFIFNLIFALTGIAIIAAGVVVIVGTNDYNHFLDPAVLALCIIMIVVGSIVFLIASMGCFGAIRESYCLLITFSVCLIIIIMIELAVGVTSAVYQDDFVQGLNETIVNYGKNENDRENWDTIQKELKCCGIDGPISWQGQNVPKSCCYDSDSEKSQAPSKYCSDQAFGKFMYNEGCVEKLRMGVKSNSKILIAVGIGIALVEVIGIFLSCWLACTIKKEGVDK
ncbi:CD63 antigen-like [Coccinella septempunctata]|uniref:CD63 antigen-like n=1 Tax=Coccinella septempunctata TaxID=41139 RepID=UPI001D08D5FF|nr:CD63 antigen-like [Coccinella septempunctata]